MRGLSFGAVVRKAIIFAGAVATAALAVHPVSAEPSQVWHWCTNARSAYTPDQQIEGCTSVIQSGRETQKNKTSARYNRGIVYRKRGDVDRAIADFNEAIQLDPKFVYAYYERGNSYKVKGDFERAAADFNEAIRLDPKFASAYNGRGNVYLHNRDFDRAIADYNEAIQSIRNLSSPALIAPAPTYTNATATAPLLI